MSATATTMEPFREALARERRRAHPRSGLREALNGKTPHEIREALARNGQPPPVPVRFEFTDLAALAQGGIEPPCVLYDGVLVDGKVTWLSGHPGHGKTTLAMHVAAEHIVTGGHVIWLDFENGATSVARRLAAVGAPLDRLAGQFHYASYPVLPATAEGFEPIKVAVAEFPDALVVFDSASKALSHAGLSEDSNSEATQWTTSVVMPTREAGATVIVIDHVPKAATRSNPYPRGAGAKLADTDVHWFVEATERFNREQVGRLLLTNQKDREGVLPHRLAFTVGDGAGKLPLRPIPVEDEPKRSKDEERADQVTAALRARGGEMRRGELAEVLNVEAAGGSIDRALKLAQKDGRIRSPERGVYALVEEVPL